MKGMRQQTGDAMLEYKCSLENVFLMPIPPGAPVTLGGFFLSSEYSDSFFWSFIWQSTYKL